MKKYLISIIIALSTALILISIKNITTLFDQSELASINNMFAFRNDRPSIQTNVLTKNPRLNNNILIIGIDNKSFKKVNLLPQHRKIMVKLISKLTRTKPLSVLIDFFYSEYSDKKNDTALISAINQYSKINNNLFSGFPVLSSTIPLDSYDYNNSKIDKQKLKIIKKFSYPLIDNSDLLTEYNDAIISIPGIIKNMKGIGPAMIKPSSDHICRKIPLFIKFKNRLYPNMVTLLAMDYFNVTKNDIEIKIGNYVKFKNAKTPIFIYDKFGNIEKIKYKKEYITIPIDKQCNMRINYVGYPSEFIAKDQYISVTDALSIPDSYFNNKIVLIGTYATGLGHDNWASPHGYMYGIEHLANSINTIIQKDFLTLVPSWINTIIILLLSIIIGVIIPLFKGKQNLILLPIFIIGLMIVISIITLFIVFQGYNKIMSHSLYIITIIWVTITTLIYKVYTAQNKTVQ